MQMFYDIASPKDFSKMHERLDDNDGDVETVELWQMDAAQKKELIKRNKAIKARIMTLLLKSGHPYFIQNHDKSVNIPINTMDCIRIYEKCNELIGNPDSDPLLWTPLHMAEFNLKEMTVLMNEEFFELVRGKTYQRPRGNISHRADASNCNLRGKWPKKTGEFAKLWGTIEKGD